jgi:hypothetical protein
MCFIILVSHSRWAIPNISMLIAKLFVYTAINPYEHNSGALKFKSQQ